MTTRRGRLDLFSGLFIEDVREIEVDEGVESFEDLLDKPHINGHILSGDKTANELDLVHSSQFANLSILVAEHNNTLTADINDLSGVVEQNYTEAHNSIEELHELLEENVVSLQSAIDDVEDGAILKLDFEDKGTSQDLIITYGDDETETLDLSHEHSQYLTQHQNISNLATKTELGHDLSLKANIDFSNIPGAYDYVFQSITYNGESGKRKWRNGRMEQWGIATSNASGEVDFALHEAFKDMKFLIIIEPREKGNFFHYAYPSGVQTFKTRISDSYGTPRAVTFQWKAEGYFK